MNTKHRNAAAAVVTGVLLCGTAACSGGGSSDHAGKPAASSTTAQKPVEVSPLAAVRQAADNSRKITSLTYTMHGSIPGSGTVDADASMSMKPLAMRMLTKTSGAADPQENGDMEIRLTGSGLYIGGASLAAQSGGKKWIKFPTSALGEGAKGGQDPLAGLGSQASGNPADESTSLTASKDLKKVGNETVDGVSTTHYSGTVTLDALRKESAGKGADAKKRAERTIKAYQDMGLTKLTMDMWIDGSDHTKQFRTRGTAAKGPLDMMIKFVNINKPVTVRTPPAAETMDLAQMMEGSGSA
ncbi:DUF1396 domain-containing protein [Streptomyces sp. NPDC051322]|uniref:DUF1396 domain-containing protein n=1 Tax=Streptomyces sp. NPDC051322 TaxID=3154645 RepID=UPI0034509416